MAFFWLSFVDTSKDEHEHLGATIVEADSAREAVTRAWDLDINPGGEVMILPFKRERMPDDEFAFYKDTLRSKADMDKAGFSYKKVDRNGQR